VKQYDGKINPKEMKNLSLLDTKCKIEKYTDRLSELSDLLNESSNILCFVRDKIILPTVAVMKVLGRNPGIYLHDKMRNYYELMIRHGINLKYKAISTDEVLAKLGDRDIALSELDDTLKKLELQFVEYDRVIKTVLLDCYTVKQSIIRIDSMIISTINSKTSILRKLYTQLLAEHDKYYDILKGFQTYVTTEMEKSGRFNSDQFLEVYSSPIYKSDDKMKSRE